MSDKQAPEAQIRIARFPLYNKIAWGLMVLFGMVGNCAGHREGAVVVIEFVSVMWVCIRIIQEALAAAMLLKVANAFMEKTKKSSKKDDPPPPA